MRGRRTGRADLSISEVGSAPACTAARKPRPFVRRRYRVAAFGAIAIERKAATVISARQAWLTVRAQSQSQSESRSPIRPCTPRVVRCAIVLTAAAAWLPAARASDAWQFQAGGTTDRINRGIDLTQGEPSVDASISWYPGTGPFAGLSGWTVRPFVGKPMGAEFVANAGYGWRTGDWEAKAFVLHYQFAHTPVATRLEYDEAGLEAGWREFLLASVTASPNTAYGGSPRTLALTYNIVGHYPLAHGFSLTAGLGYFDLHAGLGAGFFYDDIGLNYQYRSVQLQIAYFGTQSPARIEQRFGRMLVHRWVAQVSWCF